MLRLTKGCLLCIHLAVAQIQQSVCFGIQNTVPRAKRVTRPADGVIKLKTISESSEKSKTNTRTTTIRKRAFIKKLELAGQCTLGGLQFLQDKAHEELIKRLKVVVPELNVNCEDIYYCWW
ncbi:hypothetical protein COOONC_00337 [Cooperia oncophora]